MLEPSGAIAACVAIRRAPGASGDGRLLSQSSTFWRLAALEATGRAKENAASSANAAIEASAIHVRASRHRPRTGSGAAAMLGTNAVECVLVSAVANAAAERTDPPAAWPAR